MKLRMAVAATVIALAAGFGSAATANATPSIDPSDSLRAAGVPAVVAALADQARPAAAGVDTVNLANRTGGFPGAKVDAIVDHPGRTVTIVQRFLEFEPSRLHVGWVNLRTGQAGISGLPDAVPGSLDGLYPTIDRAAVLPTGSGPIAVVVYGEVPGWSGLIPLAPEYFGYLTPAAALLQV